MISSLMNIKTDVLVIGGGPGGAAAAMFLTREGIKPIVLEQETFPRFHIGESMTGEAGQLLRRLGLEEKMLSANYPVKHGVKVYGSEGANAWFIPVSARTPDWKLIAGQPGRFGAVISMA
jgi:2-polyprenyl-6-methoxyphenol hydroxylase-like FAD-dependent oxidoreductase